jgi:hypothetical protein
VRDVLPLLLVVLGALATARLTRLLTADQLTEPARRRLLQRVQEGGRLEYLMVCRWCASVWVGLPVALAVVAAAPDLRPSLAVGALVAALLTLAYSHITGLLAVREVEV